MSNNTTWTATPSQQLLPTDGRTFGMPVCAQVDSHMFATSIGSAADATPVHADVTALVAGRIKGAFPGTSVWRPPIC
jgi:hypothetical protein